MIKNLVKYAMEVELRDVTNVENYLRVKVAWHHIFFILLGISFSVCVHLHKIGYSVDMTSLSYLPLLSLLFLNSEVRAVTNIRPDRTVILCLCLLNVCLIFAGIFISSGNLLYTRIMGVLFLGCLYFRLFVTHLIAIYKVTRSSNYTTNQ